MRRDDDCPALVDQASRYRGAEHGDCLPVSSKHPLNDAPASLF